MEIDTKTVHKIGKLAQIQIEDSDVEKMKTNLTNILTWVEQLDEVNTEGVDPMFSVNQDRMSFRKDVVNEGGDSDPVLSNAPEAEHGFFVVPKFVK